MEGVSLASKLDKIRSPNLQNQRQTAVVLSAVEDTLRDQKTDFTPTAYFAAVLALLNQSISSSAGIVNKDLATSVVYLLDLVTPYTPAPLLRSKFSQILTHLAPALVHPEAEAPLLKPAVGCLESLITAQDSAAWQLPSTQIGPRRGIAGLLNLAVDHRPKVRKRAQDALTKILKNPPPSPSADHPAADMCAETSLRSLSQLAKAVGKKQKHRNHKDDHHHDPSLIHSLQLVKTVAAASGGWPARKMEPLCEVLLNISKSSNEYLTMSAFEIFEVVFEGMTDELSSAKLPRLLEVISELRPSQNDSQLLPPWIAVLSRGYEVSAQISPDETFQKLPELFNLISNFLESSSHNIRVSASECLISFMSNCVPDAVLLDPSIFDQKVFEHLAGSATSLLAVKYQASWLEVFNVLEAMFESLRWRSDPVFSDVVKIVGELRSNDSFNGKKEADRVLGKAIRAMGPKAVLNLLPLNLSNPQAGQPGRAWMLPILRDFVSNTHLAQFKSEFVPLSAVMFQRVIDHGEAEKTLEIKVFETVVQQIWSILPGYCDLPLDIPAAFDQSFAEMLSNVLYEQVELRPHICKALQSLVDSNKSVLAESDGGLVLRGRVSKADAERNINHLASFAGNLLAVLFNVYSQNLPQYRGFILNCINAYLSITPEKEIMDTFVRVTTMLETSLGESGQDQSEKQKLKKAEDKMPPMGHTLMDLVITISVYLPRDSFGTLFGIASLIVMKDDDPQLQKKAYKIIPRLAESEVGKTALKERSVELQQLLLSSADKASAPSRRDRLEAISRIVEFLPESDLHFIPSILSEVVISAKEVNEKARTIAFDLLVLMGEKMRQGGVVVNSKVALMPDNAPSVPATLEEYFTMVSGGLAGSTPHMISASITAITRILYHFRESLKRDLMIEMISTMDLFLTSNNREIVRSVLGFVKVSVISLPLDMMLPRLKALIPNLMVWSHEHKAHFRAKVKHILERMIRRFGYDAVERNTPDDDKKLIINIRKTRERRKRKKEAGGDEEMEEDVPKKRASKFETEFDEAIYGSESEDGSDVSDDEIMGKRKIREKKKKGETFIVEDEDEPLDLLDRKALANISTTRPQKARRPHRSTPAKTNGDGKLVLGGDSGDDAVMVDLIAEGGKGGDRLGGINAYMDAIKGKDVVQRGQRGRLKFSNKMQKGVDEDDEMEVDEEQVVQRLKTKQGAKGNGWPKRKGLGMGKTRGGRVQKSPRGKFGRR